MTGCPDTADLRRLIGGAPPDSDGRPLEAHLGACEMCRDRLDRLAGVTAVVEVLALHPGHLPAESPAMQRAIDRLRAEPVGAGCEGPTDFADLTPLLQPTTRVGYIGRVGGIEIRRVIGRGGMGVVYEGLDPELDRTVAVKVPSRHLVGDAGAMARFLREARAAAAVAHEHLVAVHAIDHVNEAPFLVLQYVSGGSLADRLEREGRLSVGEAARVGAEVARGLAAAHARGLVHRDIKPANILLDADTGRALVADFGLVRVTGGAPATSHSAVVGTPAFMSPEQAAGRPVDHRSDLYSLGVVLYAAAAGELPFADDSPFVVLDRIRTSVPPPLRDRAPHLPGWFCEIVHALLAKDPADRIQSAAEVAALLEASAAPPAAAPSPRRRRRVLIGGVAAALGLWASTHSLTRPDTPEQPVAGPPGPVSGFTVIGRPDSFRSFDDAVKAAADEDVIEVHGDGPHFSPAVEVSGKRLTIRAADGARPVIRPVASGHQTSPQWLRTDADLWIEGLDVQWPVDGERDRGEGQSPRCTVMAVGGRLTLVGCRIVAGWRGACVGSAGGRLSLTHCQLVADDGVCVYWRPSANAARVADCQLEGRTVVLLGRGPPTVRPRFDFSDNTVSAERVWGCPMGTLHEAEHPVRILARRNVLDAGYVVTLIRAHGGPRKDIPSLDLVARSFRGLVDWSEEGNVYRRGCTYLAGAYANGGAVVPLVRTLDVWRTFGNHNAENSIEAGIRFDDRSGGSTPGVLRPVLHDRPSGPIPPVVGADPDRLGPGYRAHPTGT